MYERFRKAASFLTVLSGTAMTGDLQTESVALGRF